VVKLLLDLVNNKHQEDLELSNNQPVLDNNLQVLVEIQHLEDLVLKQWASNQE